MENLPICHKCGNINNHYFIKSRLQYLCKDCNHTYSIISGAIFNSHKLNFKNYFTCYCYFYKCKEKHISFTT
ncbi:transposase [Campylobacter ureolyticus]|uniref:transposase n=1 Tax=Campylobacter ureolyticus TaxID=827 RepID=UPI0034C6C5B6